MVKNDTIDVSNFPREGNYYVVHTFVDDMDYRDLKIGRPIWSIGKRHSDGKILASLGTEFYMNDDYECLWLR